MTEKEREAWLKKHLEEGWPSETEMQAFIAECEADPGDIDTLLKSLRKIEADAESLLAQGKA